MHGKKPILAFAQSARLIAQSAAHTGHPVWAADCFGDVDTLACTSRFLKLPTIEQLSIEMAIEAIETLSQGQPCYLILGTGIEQLYPMLDQCPPWVTFVGPAQSVISQLKQPKYFFALLDSLNIPYPRTQFSPPATLDEQWLVKSEFGYGGLHIQRGNSQNKIDKTHYYQQFIEGLTCSASFITNGLETNILSIQQQHTQADSFLLLGLTAPLDLAPELVKQLTEITARICHETKLTGLNSIDFIVQGNRILVLEVNPRISASIELLNCPEFIEWHLAACLAFDVYQRTESVSTSYCHLEYVFAERDLFITNQLDWPEGCHDIPSTGTQINKGAPICSLVVEAHNQQQLVSKIENKKKLLHHLLTFSA